MNRASFQMFTPNTVMNSRAARIVGTIWNISKSLSVTQSNTPPSQPDKMPMGSPMTRPTSGAPMATDSEVRSPQMARVRVSRPTWSVPSQWCQLAPARTALRSTAASPWGDM